MSDSKIEIDHRPLTLVFLSRSYRFLFLLLIILIASFLIMQEPWEGLSVEAYRSLCAFLICLTLWITQLLPQAITGLLAIVIVPLLGIMPAKEAFSYFGNEAVFFILGAFILSAALLKTGLSTRLAISFLKKGEDSPQKLVYRIMLACALLSCIMPEHAVAAFFLPIVFEMARALEYQPKGGSYGRNLFMAMAWGCIIGGTVTFLGGARVPLALGIINELTSYNLDFFDWMKTSLPLAIIVFFVAYRLLLKFFPIDVDSVSAITEALEERRKRIGMMTWKEKWVAFILGTSIFSWAFYGHQLGLANIAIAAVVILFIFRVVHWKDVEQYVNWGIILMYGGAICLGRAMNSSGAINWIADNTLAYPSLIANFLSSFLPFEVSSAFIFLALLSLLSLLVSEVVSNAAVVAILLPVSLGLAESFGLHPTLMAYAVALPAGFASLFPISTPAVALAHSSTYLSMKDLIKPGLIMNFFAWFVFICIVAFLWPLLDMM